MWTEGILRLQIDAAQSPAVDDMLWLPEFADGGNDRSRRRLGLQEKPTQAAGANGTRRKGWGK